MKQQKRTNGPGKERRSSTVMMRRTLGMMIVLGVAAFLVLFWKLWQIQIVNHNFYEEEAVRRQTQDDIVAASRGTIYDTKGNRLAISSTVHNVVLSPKDIIEKDMDQDLIVRELSKLIDVEPAAIEKALTYTNWQYYVIKPKIDDKMADPVREFISENELYPGVYLKETTKRYYPYSTLASHVIGFTNSENKGAYGLEAIYENDLSGEAGRIVTEKNAAGTEMPSSYEAYIDAQNGYNLTLTIDATIQYYAERILKTGIERFEAQNGGFCIVMNPNTGAILAIASSPDYDLNNQSAINDPKTLAKLETMKEDPEVSDEEYLEALGNEQLKQWRNKALSDPYEPGSTFKPIVMAIALEEGKVTPADTFHCSGKITVPGWSKPINCHYHAGHGTQTLEKVLMNSCNPGLIQIGQRIGEDLFYRYMEDFGIMSTTGIDMQGEELGMFWPKNEFNNVNLATASFGQRLTVTPIRLITTLSSVINGGHLVEPYVVQSISDPDGNVVSYREPKEVRQVISQETSDIVRNMMESVVDSGTGKNAKVEGYRIGGKTGTSQTTEEDHLIVSFVGFAPADDPQIIVLLGYDNPKKASPGSNHTAGGYYISGGSMAALMARELIEDTLDYMGIPKQGSNIAKDVAVPKLRGKTLEEAKAELTKVGLTWKIVGSGDTVTDQTPANSVMIPEGSAVVLYLGEQKADSKVVVPDVMHRTYSSAKAALENAGLYMRAPGIENSSNMVVFSQSIDPGMEVEPGTVIEVRFRDTSVRDFTD